MTRLRQLWLLTALGTLAALMGGYFLLVSPQSNKAAALRDETATQQQMNAQLQRQIAELNRQKKDLPQQQADLARFARLIPNNPAMPALIRSLSDAADNAGVELHKIAPSVPDWAKGMDPGTRVQVQGKLAAPNGQVLVNIPVALTVIGEYSNISSFFAELEDMNRALLVGSFDLKRPEGGVKNANIPDGVEVPEDLDNLQADIGVQVMMTKKAPAPAPVAPVVPNADVTK
jgi:Tfp pilus assembly protein PilO